MCIKAKTVSHASVTMVLLRVKEENRKKWQAPGTHSRARHLKEVIANVIQLICTLTSLPTAAVKSYKFKVYSHFGGEGDEELILTPAGLKVYGRESPEQGREVFTNARWHTAYEGHKLHSKYSYRIIHETGLCSQPQFSHL